MTNEDGVSLKCTQCSKLFKYESEKKRHEESHFPRFKCKVCSKKFSFISSLRRHEKQHNRTGNVQCKQCGGSFRDDILLKRHINYKHKGCYTCPKCNISYNSEAALSSHMKIHKPEAERKYRCIFDGCNKSFNFQHHLKHHELTHTNKKQYYCSLCKKGFIQLHHLKTHLKAHDPKSWVYCNIKGCKKKFSNEYARKRHQTSCSSHGDKQHSEVLYAGNNDDNSNRGINILDSILDLTVPSKIRSNAFKKLLFDEHANIVETYNVNSCKTVIGECITKDSGSNCICAQITSEVDEPYNINPVISQTKTTFHESKALDDSQLDCEGCECASSCKVKNSNLKDSCLKRISLSDTIEYINGTVKIKDTFDVDIPVIGTIDNNPEISSVANNRDKNVREVNNVGTYILKSCEAALGKCIVSDNGAIGDGCLCAKMMIDEQGTAEEIDDITPQPNTYFKTDFI